MNKKYSYSHSHLRVQKSRGKPSFCEHCGSKNDKDKKYEWASIKKKYSDISDYIRLCRECHCRFDQLVNNFKTGNTVSKERSRYLREWRLRNIDERRKKEREKARKWRRENSEKAKEQDRIKRGKYKEKRQDYQKKYYQRTRPLK